MEIAGSGIRNEIFIAGRRRTIGSGKISRGHTDADTFSGFDTGVRDIDNHNGFAIGSGIAFDIKAGVSIFFILTGADTAGSGSNAGGISDCSEHLIHIVTGTDRCILIVKRQIRVVKAAADRSAFALVIVWERKRYRSLITLQKPNRERQPAACRVGGVRVSGGDLCEAEAPTEPTEQPQSYLTSQAIQSICLTDNSIKGQSVCLARKAAAVWRSLFSISVGALPCSANNIMTAPVTSPAEMMGYITEAFRLTPSMG